MARVWLGLAMIGGIGALVAPASAAFYSGDDLLAACETGKDSPNYFEKNYECVAYVAGAVDAFNTTREVNKLKSCLPPKVTMGDLREATVTYLRNNPKDRKGAASAMVFAATRKAWPCKASAPTKRKKKR